MPPVGFEPAIPASERPQTYVLDRTATGTDTQVHKETDIFRDMCPNLNTCIIYSYNVHNIDKPLPKHAFAAAVTLVVFYLYTEWAKSRYTIISVLYSIYCISTFGLPCILQIIIFS